MDKLQLLMRAKRLIDRERGCIVSVYGEACEPITEEKLAVVEAVVIRIIDVFGFRLAHTSRIQDNLLLVTMFKTNAAIDVYFNTAVTIKSRNYRTHGYSYAGTFGSEFFWENLEGIVNRVLNE